MIRFIQVFIPVLSTVFVLIAWGTTVAAQENSLNYDRWVADIEGNEEIVPGGGAFVYDLNFLDDSTLRIEKSTGTALIKETFSFAETENGLRLGAMENSAIPEFNNIELVKVGERKFETTIFETEKNGISTT